MTSLLPQPSVLLAGFFSCLGTSKLSRYEYVFIKADVINQIVMVLKVLLLRREGEKFQIHETCFLQALCKALIAAIASAALAMCLQK